MTAPDYSKLNALIFDSGVGGLSIAEQIQRTLPSLRLTYVGDTGFFPYGMKDEKTLSDRITDLLTQLCEKLHPDLIIIACNTASTLVLDRLRAELQIPIVGVVPAIKPAARESKTKTIGLLATQGTVSRQYTHDLVRKYASDCQVIYIGAPRLVEIAELKLNGQKLPVEIDKELREILKPFIDHKAEKELDVIVLGCTHFPLLKTELQASIPEFNGIWVDSGKAIANRVAYLLKEAVPQQKAILTTRNTNHFCIVNSSHNESNEPLFKTLHKAYWSQNGEFDIGFEQSLKERGFECHKLASVLHQNRSITDI